MILDCLRERTRTAHESLEASINILDCSLSLPAYKRLLEKFYGFYAPLELQLAPVMARGLPGFDFDARCKVRLLEQDMGTFGFSSDRLTAFPMCRNLPVLEPVARALGCLYVVEGATLGGKIIARHLQKTLQLDATTGAAFFNSYGSETGRMWRALGETLTRYSEAHAADELIVQGAVETFAAFEAWFAQGDICHE